MQEGKPPVSRWLDLVGGAYYFVMRYVRSPLSLLVDSIVKACFFAAVERKPRTLCACQPVASISSAKVAPLAFRSKSRILAPLLSPRGVEGFLAVFAAFAPLLAVCFFVAAGFADFLAGAFLRCLLGRLCRGAVRRCFGRLGLAGVHVRLFPFPRMLRA
jgi:hypothetical protein